MDTRSKEEIREYYRTVGAFLELELADRDDSRYWERKAGERGRPRVLELGAGTGRVTRLLAPLAHSVVALDLSHEMLIWARRNLASTAPKVHLVLADMREFRFACTFDLILAANDPLVHLSTGEERDRVLSNVARHLQQDGLFVLDALWLRPRVRLQAQSPGGWRRERSLGNPERRLSVVEHWRLDADGLRARVEFEYREGDRVVGRAAFRPRLWTPEEVKRRFLKAGLRVRRLLGGWDERGWDPGSASELIVEGELDPSSDHTPRESVRRTAMATPLSKQRCEPCNANTPPLGASERAELLDSLHDRWRVQEDHHLTAHFPFPSFSEGLEFTSRVGRLAEEEGHHPEIRLSADGVRVRIWTHAIDALSENDFILAAKIDNLAS